MCILNTIFQFWFKLNAYDIVHMCILNTIFRFWFKLYAYDIVHICKMFVESKINPDNLPYILKALTQLKFIYLHQNTFHIHIS